MSLTENKEQQLEKQENTQAESEIEEASKKAANIERTIEDSSNLVRIETKGLGNETDRLYNSITAELKALNDTASSYKEGAKKAGTDISKAANSFTSSVETLAKKVEKWSFYIILFALLLGAIRLLALIVNVNSAMS